MGPVGTGIPGSTGQTQGADRGRHAFKLVSKGVATEGLPPGFRWATMGFFKLGKLQPGKKDGEEAPGALPTGCGAASMPDATKDRKSRKRDGEDGSSAPAMSSASAPSGEGRMPARAQVGLSVNDFISKTKNQQLQGLKPSGPELIAYARYLGIDPVADHDLLWLAVEALEAPLPADWTEHFDSNERVFYYNAMTRVSSWTHPLEHVYRETYKTIVNFRNANMAPQERAEKLHQLQNDMRHMEEELQKEIAQWSEHTDEHGHAFFFNRNERQSTWTDPRPAKCQVLYLRMKMLRLLQSSPGHDGYGGGRFAPLGGLDFGESATKQMKHVNEGGLRGVMRNDDTGAGGQFPTSAEGIDKSRQESPNGSNHGMSDSDSDEGSKKKKKKKKHKKKEQDVSAPVRLGPAQSLRNAKSESELHSRPTPADESRGMVTSQSLAHGFADEGLSSVGRAKVRGGIRLEPIGPGSQETFDKRDDKRDVNKVR